MKIKQNETDETDKRILRELWRDCRRSYRELSAVLSMSPSALIERIKRLEASGVITRYSADMDYLKLGFEFMALVEISISGSDLLAVEKRIAQIPHVAAVWDTTGEYDAMAVLMCRSRSELSATVKKILAMESVDKTNTNVVLNVVKRLSDFGGV